LQSSSLSPDLARQATWLRRRSDGSAADSITQASGIRPKQTKAKGHRPFVNNVKMLPQIIIEINGCQWIPL
jgi:hypothetical protein